MPTTITDLKVLAYDKDENKWAECSVGSFEIKAGAGKKITANFADADFKKKYYAVDQATLNTALDEAKAAGKNTEYAVVEVLGDIELTEGAFIDGFVTVQGDKLIVAEGKVLNVANGAKVKSDVIVKGQSCCGKASDAGLFMTSANAVTIEGNVTLEAGYTGKKNARMELSANTTFASTSTITANGDIKVGTVVELFPGIEVASDNVVDIKGKLVNNKSMIVNAELNTKGAEIVNNGTIEVFGKYAVLDAQGSTVASAGKKMTNNGTFIDNVGATVGGATQYMINNGDYICKVADQSRLNAAYINKKASNIIEFVNELPVDYHFDAATKHNNKDVDLVLNASASTGFDPNKATTIGNLTIKSPLYLHKSEEIKNDAGKVVGYATLAVNGNIDVMSTFVVRGDVRNLTAKNFTVYANGGNATFENRSRENTNNTMAVSGTIEVKNGTTKGVFTIKAAESDKNIALITCTKLIEGGLFNGKPEVVE